MSRNQCGCSVEYEQFLVVFKTALEFTLIASSSVCMLRARMWVPAYCQDFELAVVQAFRSDRMWYARTTSILSSNVRISHSCATWASSLSIAGEAETSGSFCPLEDTNSTRACAASWLHSKSTTALPACVTSTALWNKQRIWCSRNEESPKNQMIQNLMGKK